MAPAPVYRKPAGDEFPAGTYRMSWDSQEQELALSGGRYSWGVWSGRYHYEARTRTFTFDDDPKEHNGPRRWAVTVDGSGKGYASGFYGGAHFAIRKGGP